MSAIIELKDVNLAYSASQTMALEDVNLVIPRGVGQLLLDQMVLGSPVYSRSFWGWKNLTQGRFACLVRRQV